MNLNILIITDLPFRKQGNQSLIRFTRMFVDNKCNVRLFTTGIDDRGTLMINSDNFSLTKIPKVFIGIKFLSSVFKKKLRSPTKFNEKVREDDRNHFLKMDSCEVIPPFGRHNYKVILRKWASFILNYFDNLFFVLYVALFYFKDIKNTDVIIGYECGKAIAAKYISILFRKKFISKYQGTVLKVVNRNVSDAKKYYPHIFYGLVKSDLCLMVNDGTDGAFYAHERNCGKIVFEPHGVGIEDYKANAIPPRMIAENSDKFILFNNASRSRWKRVDRIIRALALIPKDVLEDILLITTYHADDREQLISYTETLGLMNNVIFLDDLDHIKSNAYIQFADAVIMTNEMSNLGNPLLEAIYYGTPVISLDDGSLDGFLQNGVDSLLIRIDDKMDQQMANEIHRLSQDSEYYNMLKANLEKNTKVFTLKKQQDKEFKNIEKQLQS